MGKDWGLWEARKQRSSDIEVWGAVIGVLCFWLWNMILGASSYISQIISAVGYSPPPNPHLNELNDDRYHTDSQKTGEGEQECQWSVSQWYRTVCGSFRFTLMLLPLGHNVAAEALLNVWTHTTSFRGRMPGTPPKAFCCLMQGEE